jgi:hypothetical protein
LPCYECHNPHGSAADKAGLAIMTMTDSSTSVLIGDGVGEIDLLDAGGNPNPAGVRNFCFACHTTADVGNTRGWNGTAMAVVGAGAKVAGVDRTLGLKIPPVNGHYLADTQNCFTCHGNIHSPSPGLSDGSVPCYGCHSVYQSPMEDSVGSKTGATNADVYHHVMGGAAGDGDIAPFTGAYPTSATDVYCVSCHTDHNYFNGDLTKGANLRTDVANASGASTSNTDFIASGSYGICVSCHSVTRVKQDADTADGPGSTPSVAGADFDASAHDYTVQSDFGSSAFLANCSKCHSDEQAKEFQTSTERFGTHWSASAGILEALGAFVGNPPKEEACFKCHNGTSARYGETLSAAAKSTQGEFAMTGSTHDLTKVACANCHNVHEASAASPAADPDNTYTQAGWATKGDKTTFCLKCHDGSLPNDSVNDAATFVPYDVIAPVAEIATFYTSDGHGRGLPTITSVSDTVYAATANDPNSTWTNDPNSLGSATGDVAVVTLPTNNAFEMRHDFGTFDTSTWTAVTAASVTVRSQAMNDGWGQSGTLPDQTGVTQTLLVDGGTLGSFVYGGTTMPTTFTAALTTGEPDNLVDYIQSPTGATATPARATTGNWTIPPGATITNVTVNAICGRYPTGGTGVTSFQIGMYDGTTQVLGAAQVSNPAAFAAATPYSRATAPNGTTWDQNDINNLQLVVTENDGTRQLAVTQMWAVVTYNVPGGPYTNDDTWAIEYTTDNWVSPPGVIVADRATPELSGQTDHTLTLPAGTLTPANINNFQVRIIGRPVGSADAMGTVEWDRSALSVTYSYDSAGGDGPGQDCRDCHEQHGSDLVHLLKTTVDGQSVPSYADTADQAQCLTCHRSGGVAGSANIAQYYPTTAFGAATQTDSPWTRFGHRIETAGGSLPAGSAMPCRSCHNPHGGAAAGYMLVVRTDVNGTPTIIGDDAGELAMSATDQKTAVNVRNFCLSCHITSDAKGWDGTGLVTITSGTVLGISRTGGLLKLPAFGTVKGHLSTETAYSCYLCHGDDFSQAGSVNVHNPASGESRGGIPCYTCHTVYRDQMEDGSGSETGVSRALSYHHVLGNGSTDGDRATYPTLTTDTVQNVYCLSCHVDHDLFSPFVTGTNQRSGNLRSAYDNDATPAGASTDFSATGGGVCLGCHSVRLDRDNVNQTSESNSTYTPAIGSAAYDASAHQYAAPSTFADATTFNGDCVKCHDSEIDGGGMENGSKTSGFQTSANKFSVHTSENRRILAAMGIAIADPPSEEDTCYQCHSLSADGFKATANRDWYNAATMSTVSQGIYALMSGTYKHNVGGYDGVHRPSPDDETRTYISANKHVECADCHGVHAATAVRHTRGQTTLSGALTGATGTVPTFATTRWTNPTGYAAPAAATKEYQICFKCHSGFNTSMASWGGTGSQAWTDQALEFSTYNASYHPVVAALPGTDPGVNGSSVLQAVDMRAAFTGPDGATYGGWTIGSVMYCSDCHAQSNAGSLGPHGSAVKWMLKGPNQAWPYDTAANNGSNVNTLATYRTYSERDTNLDAANGLFCRNCHVLNGTEHTRSDHNVPCVSCHIRVPHGGKVSRLQAGNGSSTVYPGNLPARYTPNGQGLKPTSWWEADFHKQAGGTYSGRGTCGISDGSCGGSHDGHYTDGEYW